MFAFDYNDQKVKNDAKLKNQKKVNPYNALYGDSIKNSITYHSFPLEKN